MSPEKHILITGGAGYVGSVLCGHLLRLGYAVTVVDELLYGGESLLAYGGYSDFHFVRANVCEQRAIRDVLRPDWPVPDAIVHLAAIVGFPACQAVGRQVAWRYNVEATQRVFEQATELGVDRFVFTSSYSNYALSSDGRPLNEESPLNPQSLYAETKVFAEKYLLAQDGNACAPLVFRLASLYGLSPRPRFDLIVNQFVYEAYTKRELLIYQRGYSRSFLHVRDAVEGICKGLQASLDTVRRQIFNLGCDDGNFTKDEIVAFILKRLPETSIRYKDMTFGGDMRDLNVSFDKVKTKLGFSARYTADDGVREILHALRDGMISNPQDERYRNARFIVA
jgi:nucleoside-diphosphate-sugar epimerase